MICTDTLWHAIRTADLPERAVFVHSELGAAPEGFATLQKSSVCDGQAVVRSCVACRVCHTKKLERVADI